MPDQNPPQTGSIEEWALARLRANVRRGRDPFYKTRFEYVMPSPGRYEFMWFWDSCFHAVALAHLDPEMARRELRTLMMTQRADGFIGHMVYWGRAGALWSALFQHGRVFEWRRRHSAMVQPPYLAQAVEEIHVTQPDPSFLAEALPRVQAYYDWLERERDIEKSGLVWTLSPWESGIDNSPAYDEALGLRDPGRARYLFALRCLDFRNLYLNGGYDARKAYERGRFVMVDPLVNAAYADGLRSLARLHMAAGDHVKAASALARAMRTEAALDQECWDDEMKAWAHLFGRGKRKGRVLTVASIMPLVLEGISRGHVEAVVRERLTDRKSFWTHTPVPSVAVSEPGFDGEGESLIWRGPVCMNMNWAIARGLRKHGFVREADELRAKSRAAVEESYFREFYSPLTGRGMRGTNFGWATVVVAM